MIRMIEQRISNPPQCDPARRAFYTTTIAAQFPITQTEDSLIAVPDQFFL